MIALLNKPVLAVLASALLAGCASNPDWKLLRTPNMDCRVLPRIV